MIPPGTRKNICGGRGIAVERKEILLDPRSRDPFRKATFYISKPLKLPWHLKSFLLSNMVNTEIEVSKREWKSLEIRSRGSIGSL